MQLLKNKFQKRKQPLNEYNLHEWLRSVNNDISLGALLIRAWMRIHGIPQDHVCKLVGVSRKSLYNWLVAGHEIDNPEVKKAFSKFTDYKVSPILWTKYKWDYHLVLKHIQSFNSEETDLELL